MTLEFPTDQRATVARIETILGELDGCSQELVNARDLHERMGVKSAYQHWISARIEQLDLVEGEHYAVVAHKPKRHCLTIGTDHLLSLEAALQIAIMQRAPKSAD